MEYVLRDKDGKETKFKLPDDLQAKVKAAVSSYDTSKNYVDRLFLNLWNYALKQYWLCGIDREKKLSRVEKANIMSGLTMESVDIMASYLVDTPLRFKATALGETAQEKAEGVQDALFFVSDRTGFHTTLRNGLIHGLVVGSVPLKTAYVSEEPVTTTVMREGVPVTISSPSYSGPTTYYVEPFNVFPDFYPTRSYDGKKRMRYCTERGVCSYEAFKTMFSTLIEDQSNASPFRGNQEYLDMAAISENGPVSKNDFGWTKMSIMEYFNKKCKAEDGFSSDSNKPSEQLSVSSNQFGNFGQDSEMTKGMVEWFMTESDKDVVVRLNGFPVVVAPNSKRFISIDIVPFKDTDFPFGMPLAISLRDPEQTATSFGSGFIDNAKASINKANLVNRNLILNPAQIAEGVEPGQNVFVDGAANTDLRSAMLPLERGRPEDFGIVAAMQSLAQRRTGVSEYNSGVASRERVATAVTALVESLLRRMGPYMKNAADTLAVVAEKWLYLMRTNWTEAQWGYVRDDNGVQQGKEFKPEDLDGQYRFTVETEGMVSVNNEMALKKLVDIWNILAPTDIMDVSTLAKLIARRAGLPTSLVVKEGVTLPANFKTPPATNPLEQNPTVTEQGVDIQTAVNPQIAYS